MSRTKPARSTGSSAIRLNPKTPRTTSFKLRFCLSSAQLTPGTTAQSSGKREIERDSIVYLSANPSNELSERDEKPGSAESNKLRSVTNRCGSNGADVNEWRHSEFRIINERDARTRYTEHGASRPRPGVLLTRATRRRPTKTRPACLGPRTGGRSAQDGQTPSGVEKGGGEKQYLYVRGCPTRNQRTSALRS